ncbi:class I SAM-dependent methyltransferase [Arenibaculum sp.]|uniref:class I SAM-dependent methyltransferase n=1 Tax=Arenibaculum sp. TaxID=2865862 RepID=UPI002E10BFFF|nr:SAM-dependent methyltransferase [Arenibaculum sp.]
MTPRGAGSPGALAVRLAHRIEAGGPLSVADWMAACLGDREHGYYVTRDPLGAAGDFTTAPEISQTFGELLGLWCVHAWTAMGAPAPVRLVELGPGRGTLMKDALRAARGAPGFLAAASVHLVETSPVLRRRQAETLAGATTGAPTGAAPAWHGRLEDVPDGPVLVLANEFFDALPVHQLVRVPGGWAERVVALDPAGAGAPRFRFALAPAPDPLAARVPPLLRGAPAGSLFETSPACEAVAREIGRRIARNDGAALIVDYGHAPSGLGETLQAVRAHRPAPVLDAPGEADLTAHVDFQVLAEAARSAGAEAFGPGTQGDVLVRLGIRERLQALLARADARQAADLVSGVRRLIADEEMGKLFKVLALTRPGRGAPAGFAP